MDICFVVLFLLVAVHKGDNSLLSRFRNPTEFSAHIDPDPEEMDQEMYDNILEEIPQLRGYLNPKGRPLLPYLKKDFDHSDEYDFMMNSDDYDSSNSTFDEKIKNKHQRTAWNASDFASYNSTLPPNATNETNARRFFDDLWIWRYYWKGPKMATCYVCQVNSRRGIPISPACHNAFNSHDWRAITLARYFRAHCYQNFYHWGNKIETKWLNRYKHEYDRGLYRGYYGPYYGGCFKRFLDVGEVYTSRGCRADPPKLGIGYATHRYRKLELLLKGQKDACVMSSHASLTPFSRAISLYVRYHVCVCEGKFCNGAARMCACALLLFSLLLLLHLFL